DTNPCRSMVTMDECAGGGEARGRRRMGIASGSAGHVASLFAVTRRTDNFVMTCLAVMRSKARTLDPLADLDARFDVCSCGGVAHFSGLCRAFPSYVVDSLRNQWVILDSGSACRVRGDGNFPCPRF